MYFSITKGNINDTVTVKSIGDKKEMKTQLFTIQQFADLHEIGKRTLHFYDEINLFSPAIKKENGYRYYSLAQGATLEMILTLRELDMPLDAIKEYMKNRTKENLLSIIDMKKVDLDKKIRELKSIKSLLSMKQGQLHHLEEDLHAIQLVTCKKKNYTITLLDERDNNYIQAMITHGKTLPHHLFNMELGTMNHIDNIRKGNYNCTNAIFSNMGSLSGNHIRPAGTYIRAYHQGDFSDLTGTYKRILDYCKLHEVKLEGYSYEVGINDLCVMDIEEYVTMIEVRVGG